MVGTRIESKDNRITAPDGCHLGVRRDKYQQGFWARGATSQRKQQQNIPRERKTDIVDDGYISCGFQQQGQT